MGVEQSVELPRAFAEIAKWPKARVDSVISHYMEGEYDFGIDCSVVMSITGYEIDDAKELVSVHSKNDSGIINAITLLVSIISLGNSENRNEVSRLEIVFDLMDFNAAGKISTDELTILLLCISYSFSFMLEGKHSEEKAQQHEQAVLSFSKHLLGLMNKKPYNSAFVKKEEFCGVIKEHYFNNGVILVNDLHAAMMQDPSSGEEKK